MNFSFYKVHIHVWFRHYLNLSRKLGKVNSIRFFLPPITRSSSEQLNEVPLTALNSRRVYDDGSSKCFPELQQRVLRTFPWSHLEKQ